MELLSTAGLIAMLQIILIDILLAGDNAIVIGMAAKNLPVHLQKKAILGGTIGAIILRLIMAFVFVEAINNIPALRLIGGIALLFIAHSLISDDDKEHKIEAKDALIPAITTIVVADGIMSIDNVLGVIGAANGHMGIAIAGILVTVPIIMFGSSLFIKIIERFPIILYIGGAILAYAGAGMFLEDDLVKEVLAPYHTFITIGFIALIFIRVFFSKWWQRRQRIQAIEERRQARRSSKV
ncbi:MAG: YjbE family putative metal transport protein [Veillonella sp.]|nr:YjbE family putative metal transport protein [Veillonella sp.]